MDIRFDWLTFTIQTDMFDSLSDLVHDLFDLDYDLFIPCRGRYGYSNGFFHENITILSDGGREFMGVCFEISGKGCSYLYSLDGFNFTDIFEKINGLGGNISRLDVALDCFDYELDYDVLRDELAKHNYASKWKKLRVITSYGCNGIGFDCEFGSRRSDIMLRIYDKKVESKSDLPYWCRVELQFRHDLAHAFADTVLTKDDYNLYSKFAGVLSYYLRFIDRKYVNDPNKCPTLDWWNEFMDRVASEKLSFTTRKEYKPYTMEQLVYNVKTRFVQCYKVFLDLFGADALLDVIANCDVRSRNYKSLIAHFHDVQEQAPLADFSFYYKSA